MVVQRHIKIRSVPESLHESATSKKQPAFAGKYRERNCELIRFGVKCDFESQHTCFSFRLRSEQETSSKVLYQRGGKAGLL